MSNSKPSIGIIARDPVAEPLRMAAGLMAILDNISIFMVDTLMVADESTAEHIEVLGLMGARMFSNTHETPFEYISDSEMSKALLACDIVIAY